MVKASKGLGRYCLCQTVNDIQVCFCSFSALPDNISVTITSNVTNGIVCFNHSVELTCHANGRVNVTAYKWISTKSNQTETTSSIIVKATIDPVLYTCIVTGTKGENGYSSLNISSNGEL